MAVQLEFIDFIVPIALIRAKYPGGWEQCLKDHERLIGGRVWYDEHLFRDGSMGPQGIEVLLEEWSKLGFEPLITVDGERVWHECCVVEHMFGGPTRPCSWLAMTEDGAAAYLKGTEPGKTAGRESR